MVAGQIIQKWTASQLRKPNDNYCCWTKATQEKQVHYCQWLSFCPIRLKILNQYTGIDMDLIVRPLPKTMFEIEHNPGFDAAISAAPTDK